MISLPTAVMTRQSFASKISQACETSTTVYIMMQHDVLSIMLLMQHDAMN